MRYLIVFLFLFFFIFLSSNTFADISDFKIKINKAYKESNKILLQSGYIQKCVTSSNGAEIISNEEVKNNKYIKQVMVDLGNDTKAYFSMESKIEYGQFSEKPKFKYYLSPGSDRLDPQLEQFLKAVEEMNKSNFESLTFYGKELIPIAIEKKLDTSKIEFLQILKEKFNIKLYEEYIGSFKINDEEFYILKSFAKFLSNDGGISQSEVDKYLKSYVIIHSKSGLSTNFNNAEALDTSCEIFEGKKSIVKYRSFNILNY